MAGNSNHTYFPNLNGLRAIAALLVVLTHVDRHLMRNGQFHFISVAFNSFLGGLSVTFFFVLSGFLITYLLLQEKTFTSTISYRHFLLKRTLRIFPLYFFVLFLGYFIAVFILKEERVSFWSIGFFLNLFFLPNIAFAFNLIPDILIQIWSIGTEVQFYLFWPLLIRQQKPRKLLFIFIGLIVIWLAARGLLAWTGHSRTVLNVILFRTRMDCMAIGGLFALMKFYQQKIETAYSGIMHLIRSKWFGLILAFIFLAFLLISKWYDVSLYQAYAFLFGLMILRLIQKPNPFLASETMNYLGTISYGIYLLHHFWVYAVFGVWPNLGANLHHYILGELFYYVLICALTILSAMVSYHFFERRFLKMKE